MYSFIDYVYVIDSCLYILLSDKILNKKFITISKIINKFYTVKHNFILYILKDINIKNRAYYFFDDIFSIKNFHANNIKIDEKSYKKYFYLLYWICDDKKSPKNV